MPHTVPQVLLVDELITTQLNNRETSVNVSLNLHLNSPCYDCGINDINSINNITQQTIVIKSVGKYCGETDDNKNQCVGTNDIVHKTGPDIRSERKQVNRVRDKGVKTMVAHVKLISETSK